MKIAAQVISTNNPLELVVNEEDIHLIKGLNRGSLDADDQKKAFDVIVKKFCRVGNVSLNQDAHTMAASEGMRITGLNLLHIAETPIEKLIEEIV